LSSTNEIVAMSSARSPIGPSRARTLQRKVRMLALFVVGLYAVVLFFMWAFENRVVYPRSTAADHWENPPDPAIVDVTFLATDGNTIHGWYLPQPESKDVFLICHGNGGNLSMRGNSLLRFRELLGCNVLIFDYPGYGKSMGKHPSEAGCYASADAAIQWLNDAKGIRPEHVILLGDSLGGGVAVDAATRQPVRALILSKTFTSAPAAAKRKFFWLPVDWLMSNRFDNLVKMPRLLCPVLIASATDDAVVRFEMGKELFDAAPEPKELMALKGEGHNDRLTAEFLSAIRRFVQSHPSPNQGLGQK
jgi:fermentation-respiration switch protein FrsA (DUF1100 family)